MMKINVLFALMLVGNILHAQNFSIKWSDFIDVSKTDPIHEIIPRGEDGLTVFKRQKKGLKISSIEEYDKNFKLIRTSTYPAAAEKTYIFDSYYTGKNIMSFYSYLIDQKTNKAGAALSLIENADNNSKEKIQKLFVFPEYNKLIYPKFLTANSPDRKIKVYVLDVVAFTAKAAIDKKMFTAYAVNEEGELVWTKGIENDGVSNFLSELSEVVVNNNGDVFLIEKRYNKDNEAKLDNIRESKKYDVPGYTLHAYLIYSQGKYDKRIGVNPDNKNVLSMGVTASEKDDNFYVTGNYGDGSKSALTGVYFGEVSPNGEVVKLRTKNYSQEFLEEFNKASLSKSATDDGLSLGNRFKLRKVLMRADGGLYAVYEYHRVAFNFDSKLIDSYTHRCNEIIVTSIYPDGEIDWNLRIPKSQSMVDSELYISFFAFTTGNQLNLIYNDNPENVKKDLSDVFAPMSMGSSVPILRTLSIDGTVKTQVLFENNADKFLIQPGMCKQGFQNTVVLYGRKYGAAAMKEARIGILKLN